MENETTPIRWEQKFESYGKALRRLAEIVRCAQERPLTDFEKDGLVQRFEFTHEMAWKVMMSFCKHQSPEIALYGSKDSTRWAFSHELITDGEVWMDMVQSRSSTSHNYDGEVADVVTSKIINDYFPRMVQFYHKMRTLTSSAAEDIFKDE